MCTVTYIPKGETNYVLTSNRDESIVRAKALSPAVSEIGNVHVLFPKDPSQGGTWIGVTETNRTLCLLNGAFKKHSVTKNYLKSRGLVVLDFFKAEDIMSFVESYSLKGIEPFTLIIIDGRKDLSLIELKWDGIQKYITVKNSSECHIWSSATLYNQSSILHKENQFYAHLNPNIATEDILKYHESGTKEEPMLMRYINNSSPCETISITQITHSKNEALMTYKSLLNGITETMQIRFTSESDTK